MIVRRQYRGGYQVTGLVELARERARSRHPPKVCCGSFSEIVSCWSSNSDASISLAITSPASIVHKAQLVIECDGSVHESNEQWYHDRNRDAYLIAQGLRVLRFTNDRILNDTENVLEEIAKYLSSPSERGIEEGESSWAGPT